MNILGNLKSSIAWIIAGIAGIFYAFAAFGKAKAEKDLAERKQASQDAERAVLNAQSQGLSELEIKQEKRKKYIDNENNFDRRDHFSNSGMAWKDGKREDDIK